MLTKSWFGGWGLGSAFMHPIHTSPSMHPIDTPPHRGSPLHTVGVETIFPKTKKMKNGAGVAADPPAPAASGKPGKAKAKSANDSKRRKTSFAALLSSKDKPTAEPTAIDVTRGWSLENTLLFDEWGLHFSELQEQLRLPCRRRRQPRGRLP